MVSYLRDLLGELEFAFTAETAPELGPGTDDFVKRLRALKKAKYHLVSLRGAPGYGPETMSSLAAASIARRYHVEPVIHVSCRNRNTAAIQADLLGASAIEAETVIVRSGAQNKSRNAGARPVYDLDPARAFKLVSTLNNGKTIAGEPLNQKPQLFAGGVIAVNTSPLEIELLRVRRNSMAGCDFFITNPLFGLSNLKKFLSEYERLFGEAIGKRVIMTTLPLASAEAINSLKGIPGIYVPPEVEQTINAEENKRSLGIKFAALLVKEAKKLGLGGANVISVGDPNIAVEVKERLGDL